MTKKYYIWKDPNCAGVDIEWLELTGKEFYALLKHPESKTRHFIRLGNDISLEADIIYIEATEEQYRDWRREQNAHNHLRRVNSAFLKLSLDHSEEQCEVSLHDIVLDTRIDVEQQALARVFYDTPERYFGRLTEDECRFVTDLYIKRKTMVGKDVSIHGKPSLLFI
jgi:hypothetical protein